MNRRALWALLAIAVGIAVVGCSGSGGNSDESRIKSRYSQLARATEREDIGGVMSEFSPNYFDAGFEYVDMRNVYAERFDGWDNISCSYIINDIRLNGNFATATVIEVLDVNNVFRPGSPREHYETPLTDI